MLDTAAVWSKKPPGLKSVWLPTGRTAKDWYITKAVISDLGLGRRRRRRIDEGCQ